MLFYSEKLSKLFKTEDELLEAEKQKDLEEAKKLERDQKIKELKDKYNKAKTEYYNALAEQDKDTDSLQDLIRNFFSFGREE